MSSYKSHDNNLVLASTYFLLVGLTASACGLGHAPYLTWILAGCNIGRSDLESLTHNSSIGDCKPLPSRMLLNNIRTKWAFSPVSLALDKSFSQLIGLILMWWFCDLVGTHVLHCLLEFCDCSMDHDQMLGYLAIHLLNRWLACGLPHVWLLSCRVFSYWKPGGIIYHYQVWTVLKVVDISGKLVLRHYWYSPWKLLAWWPLFCY